MKSCLRQVCGTLPPLLALLLQLIRQSAASSSSGSHRGSGHHRLPPFPAGGAVQQELSLSALLEGCQLEEFTEALAEPMAEKAPLLGATVETRRWTRRSLSGKKRRRDEGEDDGTGESQKTSSSSFYFKPHCVVWSL
jgi:hypothetical protein